MLGERSLQQTVDRVGPLASPERTLVVCGPAHAAPVSRQLPALPERNVLIERDDAGNSVRGDLVRSQTRNSVVWSETGRLVALVGLENSAVVDTEDALLVVDRNDPQEVRRIVEQLQTMRRPSY